MFELRKASVCYEGREVLRDVSVRVEAGERVALVGRSGAGKSTLLKLFYGQRPADTALVPQELGLVRQLSVFHNIYMGTLHRHGTAYNLVNLIRPLQREVTAVRALVERLELGAEKLFVPVAQLSGGQQQRTAVARSIHQDARVLMGDEPVSAVDKRQSRVVLEAINAAYDTVLLAMHDLHLALAYADRIVALKAGRIVLDRPVSGLEVSDLDFLY